MLERPWKPQAQHYLPPDASKRRTPKGRIPKTRTPKRRTSKKWIPKTQTPKRRTPKKRTPKVETSVGPSPDPKSTKVEPANTSTDPATRGEERDSDQDEATDSCEREKEATSNVTAKDDTEVMHVEPLPFERRKADFSVDDVTDSSRSKPKHA